MVGERTCQISTMTLSLRALPAAAFDEVDGEDIADKQRKKRPARRKDQNVFAYPLSIEWQTSSPHRVFVKGCLNGVGECSLGVFFLKGVSEQGGYVLDTAVC